MQQVATHLQPLVTFAETVRPLSAQAIQNRSMNGQRFLWASRTAKLYILLSAGTVSAQQKLPTTDPVRVIADVRESGKAGRVRIALLQLDGPVSTSTLDAIADSLVAIVNERSPEKYELRTSAIFALTAAGAPGPRPYAGAGKRLLQIALEAPDVGNRAGAVGGISELVNRNEAVELLRIVSLTSSNVAGFAVYTLGTRMKPDGSLATLRQLYVDNSVTNEVAKQTLEAFARENNWKR